MIAATSTSVVHFYAPHDYWPHRRLLAIAAPSTITAPIDDYYPLDDYSPIDDCQRLLPPSTIAIDCYPHRRLPSIAPTSTIANDCCHYRRLPSNAAPSTITNDCSHFLPFQ